MSGGMPNHDLCTYSTCNNQFCLFVDQKYYGLVGGVENWENENRRLLQDIEILEQDNVGYYLVFYKQKMNLK